MKELVNLVNDYQYFVEETGILDLQPFANWLSKKYTNINDFKTREHTVNEAGLDVMASYLLGGLSSYVEAWVKICFEGSPLYSLTDYGIIKTVQYSHIPPSKTQIAENVIAEKTTCIEAIKRLVKAGILSEIDDEKDKRVKRVQLTNEGIHLINTIDSKMKSLGKLLMGSLDNQEKLSLLPILQKLNDFHNELYRNKTKEEVKSKYKI